MAAVHDSLEKAKKVLEQNQYPPSLYNPIIEQTLTTIIKMSIHIQREKILKYYPAPETQHQQLQNKMSKSAKRCSLYSTEESAQRTMPVNYTTSMHPVPLL